MLLVCLPSVTYYNNYVTIGYLGQNQCTIILRAPLVDKYLLVCFMVCIQFDTFVIKNLFTVYNV